MTTGMLVAGLAGPSGAAADDLESKKDQVDHHIDKQKQDLDESNAAVQAATSALLQARADLGQAQAFLAQTQGQLAAAQALDLQMQTKLDDAVAALDGARKELARGRADVDAQEDQLRRLVVSTYEQGDPALTGLSMVLTTQDPSQLVGDLNANSSMVDNQAAILDQLEAAKVVLQVKEDQLQTAKAEVAKKRQEAADNLTRMEALEQQAEQARSQVAQMVAVREQARAQAMKAKSIDLASLQALQAERDRIQALLASQTTTGGTYTGPTTGNGFLDYPVPGSITSPFGWRIHPIYGYRSLHDGVDIGAACGTPIKATAPGTVLSEYYQTAWGNRIIIDHGVHYGVGLSTISNHLSAYAVSVGDHVKRGDVIGYVGTTGWSTGCHLHFTVNENGSPVDPLKWF